MKDPPLELMLENNARQQVISADHNPACTDVFSSVSKISDHGRMNERLPELDPNPRGKGVI